MDINTHQFSVRMLSNETNQKTSAICSQCGCEDQRAAGLFFGEDKPRSILCEQCLTKLQTVIRNGRREDFERWGFSLREYNGTALCSYFTEESKPAVFNLCGKGFNLKLCLDCVNTVYFTLRNYNKVNNLIYMEYRESKKAEQQLQKTNEREEEFRKQIIGLLNEPSNINMVQTLLSLDLQDRGLFFEQYALFEKYSKVHLFHHGEKYFYFAGSRDLRMSNAFPNIKCDIHPSSKNVPDAILYIDATKKELSDFKVCMCLSCAKDFTDAVRKLITGNKKTVKVGSITIKEEIEYNSCYFCGMDSHYKVQWQNIFFHCCEICLGRLYRRIEKFLDAQFPDYEESRVQFNPKKQLFFRTLDSHPKLKRYRLNTKISDVNTPDFKFIVKRVKLPTRCDCLGHEDSNNAVFNLTTTNKKIDFSFLLDKQCRMNLIHLLQYKGEVCLDSGVNLKMVAAELSKQNHCLFCSESKGNGWLITIGNVDFYVDDKHRIDLLRLLESLRFE